MKQLCIRESCKSYSIARKLCPNHYYHAYVASKKGLTGVKMSKPKTDGEVFSKMCKLVNIDENECWNWQGTRTNKGYGQIAIQGQSNRAHRVMYGFAYDKVPDDMTIDHLCKNTMCVNPAHMEVVTALENARRSDNFASVNRRKVFCVRGHYFSEANTRVATVTRNGKTWKARICRECKRLWYRNNKLKNEPTEADKFGHGNDDWPEITDGTG